MDKSKIIELLKVPETLTREDLDNITYQPLSSLGWCYHAPESRSDSTYWLFDGDSKWYTSEEVAQTVGVPVEVLHKWENAADELARSEGCEEYGDW